MNTASDPYLYPGTDVLRNVPGLRDPARLATFETSKTAQRIYELQGKPVVGSFDTAHLKAIHWHVFQDVFPWAGQFRSTVLGKAEQVGHSVTWFTPPHLIADEAERILGSLLQANLLAVLDRTEFARGCSAFLSELNRLHPFREGNGRTQRLFVEALARRSGHELHFEVVSRARMVQASIPADEYQALMMLEEEVDKLEREMNAARTSSITG